MEVKLWRRERKERAAVALLSLSAPKLYRISRRQ